MKLDGVVAVGDIICRHAWFWFCCYAADLNGGGGLFILDGSLEWLPLRCLSLHVDCGWCLDGGCGGMGKSLYHK